MKKVSLAATVALALLGATTVANANGTVKSQPAAAAAPATTAAAAAPAMTSMGGATNPPSAELIARPGNHKNTNFELDIMVPVYQPSCADRLLAVDIRGMRDVNRNTEGNGGLVYRQIVNNSFVLGGYVYGDYRRTRNHNNFGQLTLGADILSNMVDARFNGYIAQNKRKTISGPVGSAFSGNQILRINNFEVAQSGFDGEVGVRIPMPGMNNIETRIFAGGYRFSRSGTKTMSGPRGRLEVRINDLVNPGSRLTLGVDVSNDKIRKTSVNGVIGLRIPLQFTSGAKVPPQGSLQRRLADYVYRDVNVNTQAQSTTSVMMDPATGKPYFAIFIAGPGTGAVATAQSGNGQFGSPYAMWDATAVAAGSAQAGTLTFFVGSGTITAPAAAVTPTNNQAWYGPSTNVVLADATDGTQIQVQSASTNVITINGNAAVPVLFTVAAGNPTVRKIAGFTHVPTAVAGAGLFSGAYTANAQVNISDIVQTGNAAVSNSQILVTFTGNQTVAGLSVSNVTFNGLTNTAIGVDTTTTGGAKVTLNTNTIKLVGPTGGNAQGQNHDSSQSTLTFTDTNSNYSNGDTAVVVQDDSGAAATQGTVNFTINGLQSSGMATNGISILRADGGGIMSNTSMTGTISGGVFTSAAGQDIALASGTGGAVSNVVLTLKDNKHTNTNALASAISVTQPETPANASTANISMTNVAITGVGGSSILITPITGITQVGSVRLNLTKVTTSGAANGIAFVAGTASTVTVNQIQLDFSGGSNVIGGTTNSIFGNGLVGAVTANPGTSSGFVGVAAAANTFIALNTGMGGGAGALGAQLPQAVAP